MSKPLALIASDLHLKPKTWRHRPIVGDSYYAWEQVQEEAIRSGVSFVILAGDLLDRQINGSEPIIKLQRGIEKLGEHDIKTLFIQGQHEYQEFPWASLSKHAHHLAFAGVEIGPFWVEGIDYQSKETFERELGECSEMGDQDILVMHQVWLDWMGERALPQGSFQHVRDLAPGLKTLITGDLHESRLEWFDNKSLQLLSPGSTCMQSVAEPLQKYMYYLSEGDDGLPEFERIELKSRPFVRWEKKLETPEDVNDVLGKIEDEFARVFDYADANELPEEICAPIFHFTYSHKIADEMRRIEKLLGDRAHLFWKEIPPVAVDDTYTEAFEAGVSATMADMLREEVDDEKIRHLSERMLAAPDIFEELVRWQKEQLTNESS
jgi:DNA repair exonuclease SbcCD nuclease subunit|tara:strand:+ start:1699 stop:2835 length:1137 start_codon:yes stop_codon:yes gene_type:complete